MALAAVCLIVSLLAVPAAHAVDHIVGGSPGWNQGVDYTTWASGQKFAVGDNLSKLTLCNAECKFVKTIGSFELHAIYSSITK